MSGTIGDAHGAVGDARKRSAEEPIADWERELLEREHAAQADADRERIRAEMRPEFRKWLASGEALPFCVAGETARLVPESRALAAESERDALRAAVERVRALCAKWLEEGARDMWAQEQFAAEDVLAALDGE